MFISDQFFVLLRAASFAARAHQGQYRKDDQTPYASHPFRVCLVVRDLFGIDDHRVMIAALLHDVIEDTTTDYDDIAVEFGAEIAKWVSLLSKDKRMEEEQRERAYIEQLQKSPWQVKVCKLADVLDNLMDVSQLPPDQRAKGIKRKRMYFEALRVDAPLEIEKALQVVHVLLGELEG